jgi:hypothetical protein
MAELTDVSTTDRRGHFIASPDDALPPLLVQTRATSRVAKRCVTIRANESGVKEGRASTCALRERCDDGVPA